MAEIHPLLQFLVGVAALGAALGVLGGLIDLVLRDRIEQRIHELLWEASAFTWAMGAMAVVVFVAWVYIVQGMLFEAAMFGLMGGLVLYIFVFFVYPEAAGMFEESGETSEPPE